MNVINFVVRYGNYTRKSLFVTIHGAFSKYIDVMMNVKWINGLTGEHQIIHVRMFLVMLYNACFMFQQDKETNMLITALDTFNLGADIDHDKFMNTPSEYKNLRQIPFWNTSFQTHMALKHLLNESLFLYIHPTRCNIVVCFRCHVHHIKHRCCKKTMALRIEEGIMSCLSI